jgi:penicillin G amidase
LLQTTAAEAFDELIRRLGPELADWSLGKLQSVNIKHAWPHAPVNANLSGLCVGGHTQTLNKASSNAALEVVFGPSFRLVVDVGEWQNSLAMNFPGQSGVPGDPHYVDLAEAWSRCEYFPLLWRREDIIAHAESVVLLKATPASS